MAFEQRDAAASGWCVTRILSDVQCCGLVTLQASEACYISDSYRLV